MLKVRFFARVREQLDCAGLELEWQPALADLDGLQEYLCEQYGDPWRQVLEEDNMIRAINQQVANGNAVVRDGDEVAFFPPVTGG